MRRALVLTVLLALAPAPAGAACGWVVWMTTSQPGGPVGFAPVGGHPTYEACDRKVARVLESHKDKGYRVEEGVVTTPKGRRMGYICLPDGVDPRAQGGPAMSGARRTLPSASVEKTK